MSDKLLRAMLHAACNIHCHIVFSLANEEEDDEDPLLDWSLS